jgi:hypothetical protein
MRETGIIPRKNSNTNYVIECFFVYTYIHKYAKMPIMRTTVDIPDSIYRELKVHAATEGTTIREIILEGVQERLRNRKTKTQPERRAHFPVIRSKNPGSLALGEEGVYKYIPFP